MKLFTKIPPYLSPTALTIGTFDGLHLGHLAILKALKEHPHSTVLTFANHPLELIHPPAPPLILSRAHKLELLRDLRVDVVIELPFTEELAALSYEELLSRFSIQRLLLGEGAVFGRERRGTAPQILQYAKKKGFTAEYLPKVEWEGKPISSSRIRDCIAQGNLRAASSLLGRPYGLYLSPQSTLEGQLLLPPDGRYPIRLRGELEYLEITTIAQGRHLSLSRPLTTPTFVIFEENHV